MGRAKRIRKQRMAARRQRQSLRSFRRLARAVADLQRDFFSAAANPLALFDLPPLTPSQARQLQAAVNRAYEGAPGSPPLIVSPSCDVHEIAVSPSCDVHEIADSPRDAALFAEASRQVRESFRAACERFMLPAHVVNASSTTHPPAPQPLRAE